MCHLCPYKNVKLVWKFFYINICGFIGRGKFLYETRVLDNSYLRYTVQLPTSDSTEITAGALEGPVPLDAKRVLHNIYFNFNFLAVVLSVILVGPKITLGGTKPPGCPLAENFFIPKASTLAYLRF